MSTPAVPVANDSAIVDARYEHALSEIFGRLNYERTPDSARSLSDFTLERMRELLEELGNPQLSVPTVHIAGSKGKGSTATMVARIAQAAGYRAGLFTSPHVDRFEDRFTINGTAPSRLQVADLFDDLKAACDRLRKRIPDLVPTFFELATAMGWMLFARERVDLAVMEVGLGGRLDSTNVCQPLVTVITSISRDHTRLLGNTLALIAGEKAGIIKTSVPVITNVPEPEPAAVIESIARSNQAPQLRLGHEFHHIPFAGPEEHPLEPVCCSFDFIGFGVDLKQLQLGMPGEHQTRNGALAVAVAVQLRNSGFDLPDNALREGLLAAKCPLRVEVVAHAPLIVVDAAHNPASVTALCETLKNVSARRRIVIFASSRDKEADLLLKILNQFADEIWLTRFLNNPRSIELDELSRLAGEHLTRPWKVFPSPVAAISTARAQAEPADLICVTGSFFLASEAKAILQNSDTSCGALP